MSVGMEAIRERMAEYLRSQGVNAVAAWPDSPRLEGESPVTVVSLRGCQAGPAGFQDYLGERYNEATGLWEELYGRKAKLTFGLDLYGSEREDGGAMQRAFDQLAGALTQSGPDGLTVREFSCGETEYDKSARRMKRHAQAVCTAWLYAVARPGGEFLDFELRGGIKV